MGDSLHQRPVVRVAIIGHSYVRRLDEYIRQNQNLRNLKFHQGRVLVRCFGFGGATLRQGPRCICNQLQHVADFQADIICIHLGENDITVLSSSKLTEAYVELLNIISYQCHDPIVIVGQLLPFPALCHLRQNIVSVNELLTSAIAVSNRRIFWKHRCGFWNPSCAVFHQDNVHLSQLGMVRYFNSIHAAIRKELHTHVV